MIVVDFNPEAVHLVEELAPTPAKPVESDVRTIARVREDGEVVAAALVADRRMLPHGATVEVGIAGRPRAITRGFLLAVMDEACAGVTRVEARTRYGHRAVARLLWWLGWQVEAWMTRAWDGREDALLWSITPEQWAARRRTIQAGSILRPHESGARPSSFGAHAPSG
ncbi:MAG: hypothetical protein OXH38_11880 [Chloroflexi bacterium]|nr:hypothetical protein [Chloroflexota bacterium]